VEGAQRVTTDSGAAAGARRWLFGTAVFDERTLQLRVGGQPVDLEPNGLEVLRHLLHHAGDLVTKDELLEKVWPGRVVSETVLPKCISRIRAVLGDDAESVIKTVHKYGYRLVAPVRVEAARAAQAPKLGLAPGDHPPQRPLWSLVECLGTGGQGEVWLARHDKLREQRVFKFALDAAGVAAIKREITLYRVLRESLSQRAEFAEVLDWNFEEPPCFIELEYAAGGNLESWSESRGGLTKLPLKARLEIVAKIADALATAHSIGVLHKDLKPSNVLIDPAEVGIPGVKLTDFGSGSVLDPQRLAAMGITHLDVAESMRQGEDLPATFMYLAPEVMAGQPATIQADVYSLGVILYQMVVADFKQPVAQGWDQQVGDPLLCEDIALAVAGDRATRLADAAVLATRLRSLDERWRQREAEQTEKQQLEEEQAGALERARQAELAVARLRARRNWMFTALATLIVGFGLSLSLYFEARRARNEATAAAASSRAVADFLSKDMFAIVGSRPLRDLTVYELLETAAGALVNRDSLMPDASAQIHAALGSAFLTMDAFAEAERHLEQSLDAYERLDGPGSETAVAVAAQLVSVKTILGRAPGDFTRFDVTVEQATRQLGLQHSAVLGLKRSLGYQRLKSGDFAGAATDFRALVEAGKAAPRPDDRSIGEAQRFLAHALLLQGSFEAADKEFVESMARLVSAPESPPMGVVTAQLLRAQALMELERFDEAARELSAAQQRIHQWAVDDRSSQVLVIQFVFAQLALRQGRTDQAIEKLTELLSALAGKQSDLSAEPHRWLGLAYLEKGLLAEAEANMRKAQESDARAFGVATPWYQMTTVGLADIARARGNPAQARTLLASVDRAVFERLGPEHPFVAELQRVEGLTALAEGRAHDARIGLTAAARIFENRYGSKHKFSRRARAELAKVPVGPA
jgi:eukaryotic-like serine/threonine-protein kinase